VLCTCCLRFSAPFSRGGEHAGATAAGQGHQLSQKGSPARSRNEGSVAVFAGDVSFPKVTLRRASSPSCDSSSSLCTVQNRTTPHINKGVIASAKPGHNFDPKLAGTQPVAVCALALPFPLLLLSFSCAQLARALPRSRPLVACCFPGGWYKVSSQGCKPGTKGRKMIASCTGTVRVKHTCRMRTARDDSRILSVQ